MSREANFRLTGRCVGQALDQAAAQRRLPRAITVDNGTEFTSKALDEWAYRRGVKLDYTRPGKPTDNGLIESFNGRLRDEFLNVNEFVTMHDAREKLKAWDQLRDDAKKSGEVCKCAECADENSKWRQASTSSSAFRRSTTCGKVFTRHFL